ncbi:ribonuclease HII [Metamycoplasma cloacale]|uniref:Ribonuclease n=1 Tax=Metamycoplasma cloacale TaxID=92401 RepID=A0A2Z4LM94_9BACT|nr:ribonuclease HII [Metamycoplasma cloacale]AWX42885.1 ribonuclease HII [Metamycoplasma cloacale]VEU79291.1 ribonuclease HII [Metamycoplasma cloacale]
MKKYIEQTLYPEYPIIAGCDEAGRGASIGPIVVASCILPNNYKNEEINDSKLLNYKQREKLFNEIIQNAIEYHIEFIDNKQVDLINPKQASILGMEICVKKLKNKPNFVITDFEKLNNIDIKQLNLIKGDQISINVAAASILAKVSRDKYMESLHLKYPFYNLDSNKGYYNKIHANACKKHGLTKYHRFSYKNINSFLPEILNKKRCFWVENNIDSINHIYYHDNIWGTPTYDDQQIFESMCLEIFQIGLSWNIIWNKRDDILDAMYQLSWEKISNCNEIDINNWMNDSRVIRHRKKLQAIINNAKAYQQIILEFKSFANYIWSFTNNQSINNFGNENNPEILSFVKNIYKDLKKRNFVFLGITTIYAWLQAIGVINDHQLNCFKQTKKQ